MSEGGFIKLYRSMKDWEWFSNPNVLVVFVHCLLRANWKDGRFQGHEVKRGSFVTSLSGMAKETGLSVKQVRTALMHLERTNEVARLSTSKWSVITITNYDLYQSEGKVEGKQKASEGQAKGNNRRRKEGKKVNIGVSKDTLSSNDDDIAAVIDHLNSRTGSHYRHGTQGTEKFIKARLKEGYTAEDLKAVIDKKADEWRDDEKMAKYLRPSTLFSAEKFPGYLEQCQEHDDGSDWADISTIYEEVTRANLRVVE